MFRAFDRRFLTILVLGVLAARCGNSNPTSPSTTAAQSAALPASQSQASVQSVMPASLPPSQSTQTLVVEGANFKPGLSVVFTFTPTSTSGMHTASDGSSSQTITGSGIQNLTDGSFQVNITVPGPGTYTLRVQNPSSNPSDPVTVTATPSSDTRPSVAGLSPRSPTASSSAQPVYVAGINFQAGLGVQLTAPDGSTITLDSSAITFGSPTIFQMLVTLATSGAYSLRVVNPNGDTSEPWSFSVKSPETPPPTPPAPPATPGPTVAGLSPRSPTQSSQAQTILVAGNNFVSGLTVGLTAPGGGTTTIGGSAVQNVTSTGFYMSVVLSTLGDYSLRVTNPSGDQSDAWPFTVKSTETAPPPSAPTVTAISPSGLVAGTTLQPVSVNGSNFQSGLTVALTLPNGTTTSVAGSSITFGSAATFQMRPLLATAGSYSFTVTNPSGQTSASFPFTVLATPILAPTIAGTSPRSPILNSAAQTVFVGGNNFATGLTVTLTAPAGGVTTFGGSAVQGTNTTGFYFSPVLPVTGNYTIVVTNPSGQASDPWTFIVKPADTPAPPKVNALSSATPIAGASPQTFSFSGTGFVSGLTVALTLPDGTSASFSGSAVSVSSSTGFTLTAPLPQAGAYSLDVTNPSGLTSDPFSFAAVSPDSVTPTVNGTSPDTPTAASAVQLVYVGGTGFEAGLTVTLTAPDGSTSTVGGSAITVSSSTIFQMLVVLPNAGTYSIVVTSPSGQNSSPKAFSVKNPS